MTTPAAPADGTPPQIICLGETMMMVTPTTPTPLATAGSFVLHPGGAESNVAMNLAALGYPVTWASRLGADPLAERILRSIEEHGVDVRWVETDPDAPTGLFLKDPGAGVSAVYYYRSGSAAAAMTPAYLDRLPLGDIRLLHLSGITPGLSDSCRRTVEGALDRMHGLPGLVSFDVNYRTGVWPVDVAGPVIADLAARSDVVLVGRDEAETLWGAATARAVRALLPQVPRLVVKDGPVGATEFSREVGDADGVDREVFVATPPVAVVEPVGAGDAFAAGYLSGLLDGLDAEHRLLRGHRLAAVALSSTADVASAAEIAAAAGRTTPYARGMQEQTR